MRPLSTSDGGFVKYNNAVCAHLDDDFEAHVLHHLHRIEAAMTSPVTTASVPYPLKQGVKRPMPAKQAPAHKAAAAKAAAATKQARGK